jgi:hypothetical protein
MFFLRPDYFGFVRFGDLSSLDGSLDGNLDGNLDS